MKWTKHTNEVAKILAFLLSQLLIILSRQPHFITTDQRFYPVTSVLETFNQR